MCCLHATNSIGKDETQITGNHKAVNQSKLYSQTFDQSTQRSTSGMCIYIRTYVYA